MKLTHFDDGETLSTPHYLVDAKLEDCEKCFGGTFLLPNIVPAASPKYYAVVLDESTGLYHVAPKNTVVFKNVNKASTDECRSSTCQQRFKMEAREQPNAVEMPGCFNAFSGKKYANMPTFGYYQEASSPLTVSSSVSIMDLFENIFASSRANPTAHDIADPASDILDDAIVNIGSPVGQVQPTMTRAQSPTVGSSMRSQKSADREFFESLLAGKGRANGEVSPIAKSSESSQQSADSAFFEALITKKATTDTAAPNEILPRTPREAADEELYEALPRTTSRELAQDAHDEDLQLKDGNVEAVNAAASPLTQKHELTASWFDMHTTDLPDLAYSLDLAVPQASPKPRLSLSELNLDITPDQAYWLLQHIEYQNGTDDEVTHLANGSPTKNKVHYYQPVAPRQNAMAYELYLLPHSLSSGESSSATEASSSVEADNKRPSTGTSVEAESEDEMYLLLEQEPLEESHWLDLVNVFHASDFSQVSAEISGETSSEFSQTKGNGQELKAGDPVIKMPWTDQRQALKYQKWQTMSDYSVIPWSIYSMDSFVECDKSLSRVRLPALSKDIPHTNAEQSPEDPNGVLQAAIESLDIAAVFGGKADDWSDEASPDGAESGDEHEPGLEINSEFAKQSKSIGKDTPKGFQTDRPSNRSDWDLGLESPKTSSNTVSIDNNPPLQACYRLPAHAIKAINLEYCRIWEVEGPWTAGIDEDKVFELALANVRPNYENLPDDILFWVREVNSEFSRLYLEGPLGGGVWNLPTQFEKITALALSNVEWHYFCYCLKDLPKADSTRPALEASASPKDWVMQVLGADDEYCEPPCPETTASGNEESVIDSLEDSKLHGINLNSETSEKCPKPPLAMPFLAACATRFEQLFDPTNPHGQPNLYATRSCPLKHNGASPLAHVLSTDDDLLQNSIHPRTIKTILEPVAEDSVAQVYHGSKEVAAPVTPAALLRLPNRVDGAHYIDFVAADDETADDTTSINDNASEADTEIDDVDMLASHRPVKYRSGHQSQSETSSTSDDSEDRQMLSADSPSFVSKLHQHRFFTVSRPKLIAPRISLFPAQTAVQEELDRIIEGLSHCSSDNEVDKQSETSSVVAPQRLLPTKVVLSDRTSSTSEEEIMKRTPEGGAGVECEDMLETEAIVDGKEVVDAAGLTGPLTL